MPSMREINFLLLNSSTVAAMRGRPEIRQGLNDLIARRNLGELAPLAEGVGAITEAERKSFLDQSFWEAARKVPVDQYFAGSDVAEESRKETPQAAFFLAWLCLVGWTAVLGDDLYEQPNGMPHFGWAKLPLNCARAALQIGALEGAKALADEGYAVLMSAKYWMEPRVWQHIESYRQLAARIWRKYEIAMANLADDLRDSCRPQQPNFRCEVGALLWSLGMAPESRLLASTAKSAWVPSRRLCMSLVRQSMQSMTFDPLVQYIWLEMKDRGPFNIREHKLLFQKINARWAQSMMDEMLPVPPSQSYARSLIAWFRGDLSEQQAQEYMESFDLHANMYPHVNLADFVRLAALANMVAEKFGWSPADPAEGPVERWLQIAGTAAGMAGGRVMHPEWPEVYGRGDAAFFHLIEHFFGGAASGPAGAKQKELETTLHSLENYRSAALSFWLEVVPPRPPAGEEQALAAQRGQELEMLDYLRGAYLRMLSPILPKHYMRYSAEMEQMLEDQKQGWRPFDAEAGRKHFREVVKDMNALYGTAQDAAKSYVKKRLDPTAGLAELVAAMKSHASK